VGDQSQAINLDLIFSHQVSSASTAMPETGDEQDRHVQQCKLTAAQMAGSDGLIRTQLAVSETWKRSMPNGANCEAACGVPTLDVR
jgi:hypothetical protein